jgi:hypothetical protein
MNTHPPEDPHSVVMPGSTAWPMVISFGVGLMALGVATNLVLSLVGLVLVVLGMAGWIGQMLPGQGHVHEPRVDASLHPKPTEVSGGKVEQLQPGHPGYRFRLPLNVHPISSGIKGGIVGGLVMPIPALLYGVLSGHGIWFPINLLAGMILPGITDATVEDLERFHLGALVLGIVVHATLSLTFGLIYGAMLPTLPSFPGSQIIYGGVLMPFLWTWICQNFMGIVNPLLERHVDWRWFIVSQLVYGLAMSVVVMRSEKVAVAPAGAGDRPAQPGPSRPLPPEPAAEGHP